MNLSVSIVVPVYNCEKYLNRCVDSILKQTYRNFELILVDDGSKDNSAEIIKQYAAKYDNVIGVFQENGGCSIARNNGMDKAKNDFIMFIDSDDYIDEDYVQSYVDAMAGTDYDIIMGGYKKITGTHIDFIRSLNGGEFSKFLVSGPVSKLYRRSFLLENQLYFPVIKESEDTYFNMYAIKYGAKIGYTKNTGYYYYFNPMSISNTMHKGFSDDVNILHLCESINFDKVENKALHQYFIIRYIIWYLLFSGKNAAKEKFMAEYRKYFEWLKENIPDYKKNKKITVFGPKGEQKKIGVTVYIFMLLHKLNLIDLFASVYCKGGVK